MIATTPGGPSLHSTSLRIGHRVYPVMLPKLEDPRFHLACVIISLQVLGQAVLGFDLSVAQILVSVGTCALIETLVAFVSRGVIMWPSSALLTGNGVAFILRVPGTEHGDWWSMRGAHIFAAVAAFSLVSKYAVRWGERPLFNPSNIGLVVGFLVLGPQLADPQDLWWGPMSPGIAVTLFVIAAGGLAVTRRLGLLPLAVGFWATFACGTALLAVAGHCITARWHIGPLCDWSFWWVLVTSPEILVFMLFMITDPKTIPTDRHSRLWFGVGVGVLAVLSVAPQTTEYATKVAILMSLSVACAARPVGHRLARSETAIEEPGSRPAARWTHRVRRPLAGVGVAALLSASVLLLNRSAQPPNTDRAEVPEQLAERPEFSPEDLRVPDVSVDDEVVRLDPTMEDAAEALASDVVADLRIEERAIAEGDVRLAASALAGPRLAAAEEMMHTTTAPTTTDYGVESLRVVLHREKASAQSLPFVAAELSGSATVNGRRRNIQTKLVLVQQNGHWLILDEVNRDE